MNVKNIISQQHAKKIFKNSLEQAVITSEDRIIINQYER